MISRRAFLATGLLAAAHVAGCGRVRPGRRFDAEVRRDGSGSHATLADAIAAAPAAGDMPFRILVGRGTWFEKIVIDKPNLHLVGEGCDASVLRFDVAAGMARPDGEAWGTWGCASVIVRAPGFQAQHLRIENSFDYVGNLVTPRFEPIGPNGAQAVALMLDQGSDRCHLRDVALTGHQDTLFVESGRALFERCLVTGSVDFVFGAGRARFEDCELQSRFRPGKPRQGYVAVPSTPASQHQGLVFDGCRLTREAAVPDASVALGRAWRPGRTFDDGKYGDPQALGSAVFLSCWMDAHIDGALGWEPMAYTAHDGQRVMLEPHEARLYEFDSRGPGAARTASRRWLEAAEAAGYSRAAMFGDWIP